MSHKNLHSNTFNRINGDNIKTSSSVILHMPPKGVNNMNIKNVKNIQAYRQNPIHRYSSQQELKKIPNIQVTTPKQKKIVTVQNQYFRHGHGHGSNHRNQYTNDNEQKINKLSNPKKSSQQKKVVEPLPNRKYISDTNSTTSNQKSRRQSPSQSGLFFRTKPKMIIRQNKPLNKISRQNFKIIRKLGQGKFGRVYLVRQIITGFVLAMKVIQKKKISQDNILQQFVRQLKIQAFLQHPNIISLYGFFHDETYFYSLMQVGCDGQLYTIIEQNKYLTQMGVSFITKSLLQAVQCMHNHKILHRDIKPENIVIIMGNVKMCDFGWAVNKVKKQELRSTFCGTPLYLSPEILKGYKYDQKVDLWAIGIMAYELCIGSSPFQINQQQDLYKILTQQVKFPKNKQISNQFQEFISKILHKNPKDRLPSQELLKLRFIKKYQQFQTCQQLCS